ncbi:hypothetical protein VTK73DRAFT_1884 [Phialemonium thermophilum]|uniref:BZIP domain-containing protein n=1 Tax=Phialemonium thermophilum TaxID=223376 RepID=A0ABR3VST6_9PEZI
MFLLAPSLEYCRLSLVLDSLALQAPPASRIPSPASPDSNQVAAYAESGYPTREFAAPQQSNPNGIGESQVSALLAASSPLSHGYEDSTVGDQEAHIHPELRSIQKASPSATGNGHTSPPNMMPSAVPPQTEQGPPISGPSHQAPVSVNVAPSEMNDVVMSDGRRAKRELSQSKRAAQNRAAQVSLKYLWLLRPDISLFYDPESPRLAPSP